MADNQYTLFELFKRFCGFIKYLLFFFISKKDDKKQDDKFNQTSIDLKTEYNKIDKEKEDKKNNDLDERLKNIF